MSFLKSNLKEAVSCVIRDNDNYTTYRTLRCVFFVGL
jgi:hypothetical protein